MHKSLLNNVTTNIIKLYAKSLNSFNVYIHFGITAFDSINNVGYTSEGDYSLTANNYNSNPQFYDFYNELLVKANGGNCSTLMSCIFDGSDLIIRANVNCVDFTPTSIKIYFYIHSLSDATVQFL